MDMPLSNLTRRCAGVERKGANPFFGFGSSGKYPKGTFVKKAFTFRGGTEHMWVKVRKSSDKTKTITGTLDNVPAIKGSPWYRGQKVTVKYSEVESRMNSNPG